MKSLGRQKCCDQNTEDFFHYDFLYKEALGEVDIVFLCIE
ncbi:hypothetical protein BN844_3416 [Pseudomonas sp. SHC52]|nr:hypothetical protein BN844_3416 [Pseudomonas sp. SHC52]